MEISKKFDTNFPVNLSPTTDSSGRDPTKSDNYN